MDWKLPVGQIIVSNPCVPHRCWNMFDRYLEQSFGFNLIGKELGLCSPKLLQIDLDRYLNVCTAFINSWAVIGGEFSDTIIDLLRNADLSFLNPVLSK